MVLQLWEVVLWDLAQGGWAVSDFKSHQGSFGPIGNRSWRKKLICECTAQRKSNSGRNKHCGFWCCFNGTTTICGLSINFPHGVEAAQSVWWKLEVSRWAPRKAQLRKRRKIISFGSSSSTAKQENVIPVWEEKAEIFISLSGKREENAIY